MAVTAALTAIMAFVVLAYRFMRMQASQEKARLQRQRVTRSHLRPEQIRLRQQQDHSGDYPY